MSVNYECEVGIGYMVVATARLKRNSEAYMEDGLYEYINSKIDNDSEFDVIESGDLYRGEIEGVFIILRDPFKNGEDLTHAKYRLMLQINVWGLVAIGRFNLVGGLKVS